MVVDLQGYMPAKPTTCYLLGLVVKSTESNTPTLSFLSLTRISCSHGYILVGVEAVDPFRWMLHATSIYDTSTDDSPRYLEGEKEWRITLFALQ